MRFTPLALLIGTTIVASAQNWCPPGATWTYSGAISQYTTNRITRYVGDTVLAGENAQVLYTVHQYINPNTLAVDTFGSGSYSWTRVTDDIIWLWSDVGSAWDTLYYFGAVPGSEWAPPFAEPGLCGGSENGDMVQVVDTGTMVVQGIPLRYLDIHLGAYGGRIVERMGWSVIMEPFEGCWQDLISEFKCYEDYEIDYSVDLDPGSCDLATRIDDLARAKPTLYPNPGADCFTLSLPPGPHTITLYDVTGRVLLQQRTKDNRPLIGTTQLATGVYVVHVDDGSPTLRWVKE